LHPPLTGGGRDRLHSPASDRELQFTHVGSCLDHRGWGFRQADGGLWDAEDRESRDLRGKTRPAPGTNGTGKGRASKERKWGQLLID
jgi:hypothetical protein